MDKPIRNREWNQQQQQWWVTVFIKTDYPHQKFNLFQEFQCRLMSAPGIIYHLPGDELKRKKGRNAIELISIFTILHIGPSQDPCGICRNICGIEMRSSCRVIRHLDYMFILTLAPINRLVNPGIYERVDS